MANLGPMLVSDLPIVAMHNAMHCLAVGTVRPKPGAVIILHVCRWARPPQAVGNCNQWACRASCQHHNYNNYVVSISRPRATRRGGAGGGTQGKAKHIVWEKSIWNGAAKGG